MARNAGSTVVVMVCRGGGMMAMVRRKGGQDTGTLRRATKCLSISAASREQQIHKAKNLEETKNSMDFSKGTLKQKAAAICEHPRGPYGTVRTSVHIYVIPSGEIQASKTKF
ncbi:hypothetical protein E2C01_007087 [Portunus trituberculatus]|uniref:Uncharacterized protein n=1 Tax=Portunus trituberculatus TaxID=210409 RepID=A0A5B7D3K2_PORTR|nr:hypothetical protein [Portunus trituberculatus]